MTEQPLSDPRRRLRQAVRRLQGNITEVQHVAEALYHDAGYETDGVPVPAGVWQAVELLQQWAWGLQGYPSRRPWRDPPQSG